MSMGAALGLMSKLASSAVGCSSQGAFSSALKSGAKCSIYSLKVDSGDCKGYLIQGGSGNHPKIINPNEPNMSDPHNKGIYTDISKLREKYPTAEDGDFAFVVMDVYGMYDLVSNNFIINSGTGDFTPGKVISTTNEYQKLNFLQSSGTQYIDTGITYQANDKIEVEVEVTPLNSNESTILGVYKDSSTGWELGTTSSNAFYGNTKVIPYQNYNTGTKYAISSNNGRWKYNLIEFGSTRNTTIDDLTITLFARKTTSEINNFSSCRIHSYKHTRNNQLILNLIPITKPANLVRWKWDTSKSAWINDHYTLLEPMIFNTEAAAIAYKEANNLQYEYPDHTISIVSVTVLMGYTPESEGGVNQMADGVPGLEGGLSKACMDKYTQVIAQERTPTSIDFLSKIKETMMAFF